MKDIVTNLNWAINTIKDKLTFGRDELGAAIARETRAKGVMVEAVKYIEQLEKENKIMKEELCNERKCIEKCGDFETSYDDLCFMSKDCLIKHCENLRQIARSNQSRKKQTQF